jgi:hypothetical protein
MRALFEPAEGLTITQTGAEIAIDEKYGRLRRVRADGKKYKADNGTAEVRSVWKDGKLVIETRRDRGGSIVETWERGPDGSRLIVNVKLEGGFGPALSLKRIYDRAKEPQ